MRYSALCIFTLAAALCGSAKVHLPQIIADNMVVQRGVPVKIWGTADPGESVTVTAVKGKKGKSYKKAEVTTTANSKGKWMVSLPAMAVGTTYTITVNDITIDNVTPGDVFVCSGQSNMELPVNRVTDLFADEVAAYDNPDVREFAVPNDFDFHTPLDDVKPTRWKSANPTDALDFSATAYFFGKSLYELTGVPVGLIRTCWGGTPIEAWMSEEAIAEYPRALNEKRLYESDSYRADIKRLEGENYYQWESVLNSSDPGLTGPMKFYDPKYNDSDWQQVDLLSTDWADDGLNPINGSHWFRKDVILPDSMAGKPGMIRMGCIVDADSVWVNGVFVGNTTYQYPPRKYSIPEGVLRPGRNNVTVRLISQNGTPHFVPEKPYKIIAGDSEVSLEGKWHYRPGTPMVQGPAMEFWCYKPVVLYNAMVHPLLNYPVSGVVWYQGESNTARYNEYCSLLQSMIADWRKAFGNADMPFYVVELADFMHPSDTRGRAEWANFRREQAKACDSTEGAYLIHNSDLGEWNDIHPLDKKTLGKRIADEAVKHINDF